MYYKELIPKNINKMEQLHIQLAEKGEQRETERLADFYYFEKNDLALAEKYVLLLAEQGVTEYQYRLGAIYSKPMNGKDGYEKAFPWFLKSAEAGDLHAKLLLVTLYKYGLGVKQDQDKAMEWLNSAFIQDPKGSCRIITEGVSEINKTKNECSFND